MSDKDTEHSKQLHLKHRQDRDRRIMAHKLHMENAEKMNREDTSKKGFAERENEKDGLDEGNLLNKAGRMAELLKDKTSSMRNRIRKSRARAKSLAKGL